MLQFQTVEKYLTSFRAQDPQTIYLPIGFILKTCTLYTLDTRHEKNLYILAVIKTSSLISLLLFDSGRKIHAQNIIMPLARSDFQHLECQNIKS